MTAPRQPIEVREFPRPDLPPGGALLRTSLLRGVRHRRASLARPSRRRAVSDHSRPRLGRHARRDSRHRCTGIDGAPLREGRSRRVLRRASHVRPLPRLHGSPHADALRVAPRLRHHRFGRRRAVRRMGAGDLPRAGRRRWRGCRRPCRSRTTSAAAAVCITAVHIIERAEISLGDTVVVQGAGAVGLSAIALARLAGAATVIAIGAPGRTARPGPRDGRRSRLRPRVDHARRAARCTCVRRDPRRRRRRRHRGRRIGAALSRRACDLVRDGGRYVIAGHYTDVGRQRDQRAPADQPQASGDPRMLGQRGPALPPRAGAARSVIRRIPLRQDRRPTLRSGPTQRGARRCGSDANPESAGRSVGMMRHTKIIATAGSRQLRSGDDSTR